MTHPMDLSLAGMYGAALRAVRDNLLIYLLLLLWGFALGVIIVMLFMLGGLVWLTALAATAKSPGSSLVYVTAAWIGIVLLTIAILSAATKAGVLGFGAKIRRGEQAGTLDFLSGILRFTLPLFVGGLVVGMLSSLPALIFASIMRISLAGMVSDVLTSGWNFRHAIEIVVLAWNLLLVAGALQMLIFFWIAPWDEMVVLYEVPYAEALTRSFGFVFSKRHLVRVVSLVLANVILAQILLLLSNLGVFREGLSQGFAFAYLRVLLNASTSSITTFLQIAFMPFFAFAQLYLLPWPERQAEAEPSPVNALLPRALGTE